MTVHERDGTLLYIIDEIPFEMKGFRRFLKLFSCVFYWKQVTDVASSYFCEADRLVAIFAFLGPFLLNLEVACLILDC